MPATFHNVRSPNKGYIYLPTHSSIIPKLSRIQIAEELRLLNGSHCHGGRGYRQSHIFVKPFIRQRDNFTCQLCGAPGRDVDHIIPWYVSHNSMLMNLQLVCHKCNLKTRRPKLSKGVSLDEFYSNPFSA